MSRATAENSSAGAGAGYPYPPETRRQLQALVAEAERAVTEPLVELEAAVTAAHLDAVRQFMAEQGIKPESVDLVGLHGQTVYHRPEIRFTRQLIDGPAVAKALGILTVDRFRYADVEAGGEGAPSRRSITAMAQGLEQPVMVLNLGGVGNVTYIDGDEVIAFDTGPASAILDDSSCAASARPMTPTARFAVSGKVREDLVADFMVNLFRPPGRPNRWTATISTAASAVEALSDADGAATLAAFTVESAGRCAPACAERAAALAGDRRRAPERSFHAPPARAPRRAPSNRSRRPAGPATSSRRRPLVISRSAR